MFKPPTFRCRVSEKDIQDGPVSSRLVWALTEQAARESLERKGYRVLSVRAYRFEQWEEAARRESDSAAKFRGKTGYKFRAIWGPLKEHLQDLYGDKCAYCDGSYRAFGYGDVEHFRPKGAVTEDPSHPGYWWLAFDPSNYLPSCQLCNQEAKKNRFPVAGARAFGPKDSLAAEEALLLHPDSDQSRIHLKFNPSSSVTNPGHAVPITDKGRTSIEAFRLNR